MVSVIIPAYNRATTIERSVRSVLNQTYLDLECIVVDDGSTDDTFQVLDRIEDSRLHCHRMEQNSGGCAARNRGINLAQGDYIAFQDSDDVWHEDKLAVQLEAMNCSGADVCFCGVRRFDMKKENSVEWPGNLQEGIVSYRKLYETPRISTQTILAKKEVFEKFIFDEKVRKAQDYDWALQAGDHYTFFFVDKALVDQYLQKDSITVLGEKTYTAAMESAQYQYCKYKDKYEKHPDLEKVLLNRVVMYKVLEGKNASEELKRLYKLTGKKKDYLKYLAEKTGSGIMRRWYQNKRKNDRNFLLNV